MADEDRPVLHWDVLDHLARPFQGIDGLPASAADAIHVNWVDNLHLVGRANPGHPGTSVADCNGVWEDSHGNSKSVEVWGRTLHGDASRGVHYGSGSC